MNYVIMSCEKVSNPIAEKLNMFLNSDVYYDYELEAMDFNKEVLKLASENKRMLFITSHSEEKLKHLPQLLGELKCSDLLFVYDYKLDMIKPLM